MLITPLVAEGWERAVLVNRGWVPAAWRDDAALRSHGEPSGQACPHLSWEMASSLTLLMTAGFMVAPYFKIFIRHDVTAETAMACM